ncbi:hypothetical protein [Methylobacterium sp. 13MFTsu3.1M2]|uniref:hypothetical protein n=1 Tax=Methylobacterium sp. 13MFTsu3.1M2 TaxID=1502776 RepID=UPI0008F19FC7|nr:hypothetical protein [Methylobacterium sp. 13MFTsu3.1M2]SFD66723.1 hypothetical protein SAMN02799627_01218 [Methylobacterium sp. 13MFTsu3.1M2]
MADTPDDTQAERMPHGEPERVGLADSPRDTATGTVRPQDGPMERAGTEKEEARQGGTSLGAERGRPGGGRG